MIKGGRTSAVIEKYIRLSVEFYRKHGVLGADLQTDDPEEEAKIKAYFADIIRRETLRKLKKSAKPTA